MTRAVQNLRISDSPAAQPCRPATANNEKCQKTGLAETKAERGTSAVRSVAQLPSLICRPQMEVSWSKWCRKHGGQVLLADSVGQLRWLVRQACVAFGTIRSQRFPRHSRELRVGDTFQDRRQPGHQDAAGSGVAASQQPPQSWQPVPGDPLHDRPLPNCPTRDVVLTERDKQLLTELRRASAMALPRYVVSRYATAWAESLEGAMSGRLSWALICRNHCRLLLAEIPKGVDRTPELKQRLRLWEANQRSDQHLLGTRLAAVTETATSTYLSALDEDQATAKLHVQEAAQAADEAWQQTIGGLQGPVVANPTIASLEHPGSASQDEDSDEDSDDMDFPASRKSRLSAPQLHAHLSRLTDRNRLRRLKDTLLSLVPGSK